MGQTTFTIRMDEDLKREFNALCENIGMTMTTAICVFAKKSIAEQRIPFALTSNSVPSKKIRIGVAKGKLSIPKDFDKWDKEIEEMFGDGDLF